MHLNLNPRAYIPYRVVISLTFHVLKFPIQCFSCYVLSNALIKMVFSGLISLVWVEETAFNAISNIKCLLFEPLHEKTDVLHMRKQIRRLVLR